jgi:hypothetical protein
VASKANPIILVPGFLGSELEDNNATIWAYNVKALRTILNPSYLLPWRPLEATQAISVYDPLIQFLKTEGYNHDELFVFPYDWRCGIELAATSLSNFVNRRVRMNMEGRFFSLRTVWAAQFCVLRLYLI